MIPALELLATLVWLILAFRLAGRQVPKASGWLKPLTGRRAWSMVVVGLLGIGVGAAGAVVRWPEPRVHDEFSYLLAADTFSRGRLTNPTHPLWTFFETFHVNLIPTYSSIYPPAQGAALTLGQVLSGSPIVGVWISFGLACVAVVWMLQAFVPARWALAGGLLAVIRLGVLAGAGEMQGYWAGSYWGGAVAMLGGALVFGALPRLLGRPRIGHAVILAIGLGILANSRPFEGLVVSIPVVVVLATAFVRRGSEYRRRALGRVVLPAGAVLTAVGLFMAYYNVRLTGSPTLLPYEQNGRVYGVVPLFLGQSCKPEPAYRHGVMREYQVTWAEAKYEEVNTVPGYAREVLRRIRAFFSFYCGVALLVPLFGLFNVGRAMRHKPEAQAKEAVMPTFACASGLCVDSVALTAQPSIVSRRGNGSVRWALLVCGILAGALLTTSWFQPHYTAPVACLMILLIVQGLRRLRRWRWAGRPVGRFLVRTLPLVYLGLFASSLLVRASDSSASWHLERARLLRQLEADDDRHLVIVRYRPDHSPHEEWVYNRADIDGSKVVWARDMGAAANDPLLEYFRDRRAWLLDADARPPRLIPYPRPEYPSAIPTGERAATR